MRRGSAQAQLDRPKSSILTLPPEITSEIFLKCFDPDSELTPLAAPWVFLAICSSWRANALSAPASRAMDRSILRSISFLEAASGASQEPSCHDCYFRVGLGVRALESIQPAGINSPETNLMQ
ncbi:hypothetical protein C8J57DRAFT_1713743 [Mycena rebaudengoi]|nr:hypothetical protein C8J57DRAFT_1713743 [Mycena rebaudengoi]